jgi:hypothetical protein
MYYTWTLIPYGEGVYCALDRASCGSPIWITSGKLWRVGSTAVDNGMESEVIDNSIKG